MRKNGLLSFIFGMFPGAGQMYLGYMKRGVSLMAIFFGICSLSMFFRMEAFMMLLPIVWFYSFFDTLNLNSLPYADAYPDRDDYLFHFDCLFGKDWNLFMQKRHLIIGIICVALGIYMVLENIIAPIFERFVGAYIYDFLGFFPTAIIAVVIIMLGLRLVKGERTSAPKFLEDDLKEYSKSPDEQNK